MSIELKSFALVLLSRLGMSPAGRRCENSVANAFEEETTCLCGLLELLSNLVSLKACKSIGGPLVADTLIGPDARLQVLSLCPISLEAESLRDEG